MKSNINNFIIVIKCYKEAQIKITTLPKKELRLRLGSKQKNCCVASAKILPEILFSANFAKGYHVKNVPRKESLKI